MPRFRLLVAYDGTDFHGWQRQEPPGEAPLRTVQGAVEEAVATVVGARVPVTGASRTDAGVHAAGQVAAFTAETSVPADRLALAINARLPRDVRVLRAEPADPAFDPISDCVSKCYRYTVVHSDRGLTVAAVFDRRTAWSTWHALDHARMRSAADALVGTHDFAAFAQVNHGRESTVRTVHGCSVTSPAPGRVVIEVAGNGFLYNMVRIIAGTLCEAGRARIGPDDVRRALATGDRAVTGPTLPPHGLRLEWVRYGARSA
jgi:tRNA pseudouridine38-40 synthase